MGPRSQNLGGALGLVGRSPLPWLAVAAVVVAAAAAAAAFAAEVGAVLGVVCSLLAAVVHGVLGVCLQNPQLL